MQRLLDYIKEIEGTEVTPHMQKINELLMEVKEESNEYMMDVYLHNLVLELVIAKTKVNRVKKIIINDLENYI